MEAITMELLYRIAPVADVHAAKAQGYFESADLAAEGFIHCSFLHQVIGVSRRHYAGQQGLVLFSIDPAAVDCEIRVENTSGGTELYPHIYGRVPWAAVKQVYEDTYDQAGMFTLPVELR
ncbi:glutathione s-transferase domain protein [Leptolyngbya sp. Heron Island J]|uniref:DUF952 domain-containing protein n=1 Tax=Leptolyngbya sp. Heron Island J TaxID=1385935 RepID=UPI0003B992D4|nr:DUF952 domain-containing protein [Leptolyngbya sp. Heron Island J]ESA36324.1 glutathione s-transferase domain protein [Leptolyngbya sp. Heron Island J]